MIKAVRNTFPDRSKVILHYNECAGTFGSSDGCKGAMIDHVWHELDWISIDKYRGKSNKESDFISKKVKDYYKKCIYPKLKGDTKVCIVPGASPGSCPSESLCLQDAKDTVKWAESDSKVACITPYRWDDLDKSDWSKVQSYWKSYGKKALTADEPCISLMHDEDACRARDDCQSCPEVPGMSLCFDADKPCPGSGPVDPSTAKCPRIHDEDACGARDDCHYCAGSDAEHSICMETRFPCPQTAVV